jgi:hypothetical protein
MFEGYLASQGLVRYQRVLPWEFVDNLEEKPCVIVLGVGHSGTSILTRMLHSMGWSRGDADETFAESVSTRRLNQYVMQHGNLPYDLARKLVSDLARPWALKDPRFVQTLHHWLEIFEHLERKPVLLWITRSIESMLASYRKRGAPGDLSHRIRDSIEMCREQYERWPWAKFCIEYERIAEAVQLFDPQRANTSLDRRTRRKGQRGSGVIDSSRNTIDSLIELDSAISDGRGVWQDSMRTFEDSSAISTGRQSVTDGSGSEIPFETSDLFPVMPSPEDDLPLEQDNDK